MTIDPNNPKLTAYALGELEGDDLAEMEAQIARSETLRLHVEDIRATADLLKKNLQKEPILTLSSKQRALIESRLAEPSGGEVKVRAKHVRAKFLRRYWIPASIAASLLVVLTVGYVLRPSLSRARSFSPRLAAAHKSKADGAATHSYNDSLTRFQRPPITSSPSEKEVLQRVATPRLAAPEARSPSREIMAKSGKSAELTPQALRPVETLGYVSGGRGGGGGGGGQSVFGGGGGHVVIEGYDSISYGYQVPFGPPEAENEEELHLYFSGFRDELQTGEAYDYTAENPLLLVLNQPLSNFSIDIDTASYSNVRRFLMAGRLPPREAVRIEEMINYFDYDYAPPTGEHPFSVNVEVTDCPWAPTHRLARIGIKGMEFAKNERPPANLVFLIDVSGSMQPPNRLPLLQQGLRMLVDELSPKDSVAIVVYAGASGLVLPSTPCRSKGVILSALDNLRAGGSTNGGAGIQLAYDTAADNFIEGGVNRVILATDGDFNVGITGRGELLGLIEEKAKTGVFLTVLGVGMGNLKDATLETLADKGNGNYAYIDTLNEAQKVLVDQIGGTLVTIAKDVKIQVEFNPAEVSAYRLIGYENRLLAAQDFNDDKKDAGEIGAGHTVTAFFEIVPASEQPDLPTIDPLKYQTSTVATVDAEGGELMTVKLRYKAPDGDVSELIEVPVVDGGETFADSSDDFALATAVASFGMLLRGSPHSANFNYAFIRELADSSRGDDPFGYRAEFIDLVDRAAALSKGFPNRGVGD